MVDTGVMITDAEKGVEMMDQLLLARQISQDAAQVALKNDKIVLKYYIKALTRFDKYQIGVDPKSGFQ